jgi:hypothetical protein
MVPTWPDVAMEESCSGCDLRLELPMWSFSLILSILNENWFIR